MEEILAIDFGTTNSVVFAYAKNEVKQIWNNQNSGEFLFPSFVEYTGKGVVVGNAAKLFMGKPGHFVVSCVKRLIGKTYDEYLKLEKKDIFGCDVVRGDDGYPYFVVSEDATKKVSCIDVACELFKWIKASAEAICERTFAKAYVTKPANYFDNQVKAIREAARRAGLKIDKMINEPTAAGLSWCVETKEKSPGKLKPEDKILVVDFGGGTLDFSVIRYLGNDEFNVEDNSGNPNLGGNDIDYALMQLILDRLKNNFGVDIEKKIMKKWRLAKIRNVCEERKISFNSRTKDADVYERFLKLNESLVFDSDVSDFLSSSDDLPESTLKIPFREVTEAYMNCLKKAIKPLRAIIDKPGQRLDEISYVLLVGGSSRLMAFHQLLYREGLKRTKFVAIDPMTCVARGAFELSKIYNDPTNKVKMTEKIAISYGLKSGDNKVVLLLKKGMKIPATSEGVKFINTNDEPARIEIMAYQCVEDEGKYEVDIEKCSLIKAWQFENPIKFRQPKGEQLLELQFELHVGGTLQVTCKDVARNKLLLDEETNVIYENQ